jgi:hypothetical protein
MNVRSDQQILKASLNAGYVGGGYYNPVGEFLARARRLQSDALNELLQGDMSSGDSAESTFFVAGLFKQLSTLIHSNERVFGVYARKYYQFAVLITGEERLMDFEVQVSSKTLSRIGFFALDKQKANEGLRRVFKPQPSIPAITAQ